MDSSNGRVWYWVGFAVLAFFVYSYGAGWYSGPVPGSPVP